MKSPEPPERSGTELSLVRNSRKHIATACEFGSSRSRALALETEADEAAPPVNVAHLAAESAGHGVSFEPVGGTETVPSRWLARRSGRSGVFLQPRAAGMADEQPRTGRTGEIRHQAVLVRNSEGAGSGERRRHARRSRCILS
nr:unnamed protein product [Digitaria exilis]